MLPKERLLAVKTLFMYLLALSAGLIWGITFSLARIATEAGMHPLGLAWWQAVGGGILLLLFTTASRTPLSGIKSLLIPMLVIGICGSIIPGTLLFYAARYIPAGVLAITIALVPMLTYGASILFRIDRLSIVRVCGVALGFVAIGMIMLPGSVSGIGDVGHAVGIDDERSGLSLHTQIWIALALLACVFYTIENIYVDKVVPNDASMPLLLGGGMLMASLILTPVVFMQDAFVSISLPLKAAEWSVISMMIFSAVAYLMFLVLIQNAGAVFASMTGYVVTLSGVFWGIVFFGETHSGLIWIALFLMLLGMLLVTPRTEQTTHT